MKNRKFLLIPLLLFLSLMSISSINWDEATSKENSSARCFPSSDSVRSLDQSTADLYKSNDHIFVGDFIESRSKVDFSYHSNYQKERQLVQERIVHKYLRYGKSVDSPKIIFTAGVMGVGKGHVLKKMGRLKQINLQDYLWISCTTRRRFSY